MAKKQMTIGEVITEARKKKGLKAEEVAALCSVTRGRYYQWEADHYIHPKNLPHLAAALGLKLKKLQTVNGTRSITDDDQRAAATGAAA